MYLFETGETSKKRNSLKLQQVQNMTKLLCPYCHIAIATNIRTPHIKNIDKQYNYLIQSQERQTSGQYSCSLDDSSPLWTINSCTIQLPILLDLPQTYSPSKVGLQHSQNGAESKIIIHSNTHYHNLLSSGEVTSDACSIRLL